MVDQLCVILKVNDVIINVEWVCLFYIWIILLVFGKVGICNVDVGNLVWVGDSFGLFSVIQIVLIFVVFFL